MGNGNMKNIAVKYRFYFYSIIFLAILLAGYALLYVYFQTPEARTALTVFLLPTAFMATVGLVSIKSGLDKNIVRLHNTIVDIVEERAGKNIKQTDEALLNPINQNLRLLAKRMHEVTEFCHLVGDGNFDYQMQYLDTNTGMGKALEEMRHKLVRFTQEEHKRNWHINGVAHIGDMLRQQQNTDMASFYFQLLREIVVYLKANQGGMFIVNDYDKDNPYIELVACYAYERRKYIKKRIAIGEGLVGQCVWEKEQIFLTEVPADYLNITSGLGQANPRCVLLMPIKNNDAVIGVLELASFSVLEPHEIRFVETVAESLGATIASMQTNSNTQKLLSDTMKLTEELKYKEEILRQNGEELLTTQEELNLKLQELEKESILNKSILDAINRNTSVIELDMKGRIISANDMFLSLIEYDREEIIGKPERLLVSQDEILSQRYDLLWSTIENGSYNSGEFKRRSKSGKDLWLSGSYSPIFGLDGKPYKIIQFAQFTTEQKAKELEMNNKLDAINKAVNLLEISVDKKVVSANAHFLKMTGYNRIDLKGMDFGTLVLYNDDDEASESDVIFKTAQKNMVYSSRLIIKTKDGSGLSMHAIFNAARNLEGEIHKYIVVLL
jgi:PAS domain S-box-containing protein